MIRNLRLVLRSLALSPVFALTSITLLALGIAATTAVFSVVDGVLVKPLPYTVPNRLVQLYEVNPELGWERKAASPLNYLDWQQQNETFEEMAAYAGPGWGRTRLSYTLTGQGEPRRLLGDRVFYNLFSVLGVQPALGRTFHEKENWSGSDDVVILSDGLWRRLFAADPEILGRKITLNGRPVTVIGVMPKGFYFPNREFELWVPLGWDQENFSQIRGFRLLRVMARLKDDVSLQQAQAEMDVIGARLEQQYPDTNKNTGIGVAPILNWMVGDVRATLLFFLAAAGIFLMVACANVANLLLVRSAAREKEIATRLALGASPGQLFRILFGESLVLAVTGGLLGLALSVAAVRWLTAWAPADLPRMHEVTVDWRVMVFAAAALMISTLLFGLLPSMTSRRLDLTRSLAGRGALSARRNPFRNALVAFEVVVSVALLIAAGLMLKSVYRLGHVDTGFQAQQVLAARVSLSPSDYDTPTKVVDFYDRLQERVERLPGVESVGAISKLPMFGIFWTTAILVEGRPPDEAAPDVRRKEVTPGYFKAMGIPVLLGRAFNNADGAPQRAAILNQSLAQRLFPDADPIGSRLSFGPPQGEESWMTIVGVVGDERQDSLREKGAPEVYEPLRQKPLHAMALVVRSKDRPESMVESLRSEIRAMDPNVPVYDIEPMQAVLNQSIAKERFSLFLLGAFAVLVVFLAGVGIFGVISYSVAQRSLEIGIRMALGARGGSALVPVMKQTVLLILGGVLVGGLLAWALGRVLSNLGLLFQVSPTDPTVFLGVAAFLAVVSLVAGYIPARKAAQRSPAEILSAE